jgi:tetratricopeptide (TPR) repeat protein
MTKSFRSPLGCLALSAVLLAGLAQAQTVPTFEDQIQQGQAQLAAGNAESALNLGDAAIRIDPERWDGYALAGQALLALKHYEAAADALSKAIERAPAAEQATLREQRRQSLIAEVAGGAGGGAGGGVAASTPAPVPAAPPIAAVPAPAVAAAPPGPAPPVAAPPAAAPVQQASVASAPAPVRHRTRKGRAVIVLDPADAAWTDASTGLMWSKPSYYPPTATGPWNYPDARAFCAKLQLLGHDDWRLPTVDELQQIYLVSSHAWRWSEPKFLPESGMNEGLKSGLWRVQNFSVNGGDFSSNRLLLWSSSPGDEDGEHVGVYFGRPHSVQDGTRLGDTFPGESRRNPFHGYAVCVRSAR